MTISKSQLLERRLYIGSSDVAAICGVNPWKGPVDVWLEKTQPMREWAGNKHTDAGNYAEEGLICYAEDQMGVPRGTALRNVQFRRTERAPWSANLDAFEPNKRWVIEAKTSGDVEAWGVQDTDEVPEHVLYQVQHQLYCANAEVAMVVLALSYKGLTYRRYFVQRSDELIDHMLDCSARFWNEHVEAGVKPEGVARQETLRRVEREVEETTEMDQDLVDEWLEMKLLQSEVTKKRKDLDAAILNALGTAEIGLARSGYVSYSAGPNGKRTLRWKAEPWDPTTESEGKS